METNSLVDALANQQRLGHRVRQHAARFPRATIVVKSVLAFVLAYVLGLFITGAIWIWAVAQELSNGKATLVSGFVEVHNDGGSVHAEYGPWSTLLPLLLGAAAAGIVFLRLSAKARKLDS